MSAENTIRSLLGIPWLPGGRTRQGADCLGLVLLYAQTQGVEIEMPNTEDARDVPPEDIKAWLDPIPGTTYQTIDQDIGKLRNRVIFFADHRGQLQHVGIVTPQGRLLHSTYGGVRFDNDFRLLQRIGLHPAGSLPINAGPKLGAALHHSGVAGPVAIILIAIAVVSLALSILLMPKIPKYGSVTGRYGPTGLVTQQTSQIPVPDLLGKCWVAGNLIYQEIADPTQAVADSTKQASTIIIGLGNGPFQDLGAATYELRLNGLGWDDIYWFSAGGNAGLVQGPAQTLAEAFQGAIGGQSNRPSFDIYLGNQANPLVDARCLCDRDAPIYPLKGTAYAVFRLFDSSKFGSVNLLARVTGRTCRTYNTSGFVTTTVTSESVGTGDGTTTRWMLSHQDIAAVTTLIVAGTAYTLSSPGNQGSQTYWLNATYGYLEFTVAPASSAAIVCTYSYYPRANSSNPADHLIFLLTQPGSGKGLPATKIDWPSFVDAQTYFAANVTTYTGTQTLTGPRYATNYVLDTRAPFIDHLKAVLNACNSALLLTGGKIKLKTLAPGSSIFSFDPTNIVADTFDCTLLDRTERANRLILTYHDGSTFSSEQTVVVDDVIEQANRAAYSGNDGVIEQTVKYPAIDNQAQALRIAQRTLVELTQVQWQGKLTTTVLGLALEPGDIIDITHPAMPSWSQQKARIDQISHDESDRLVIEWSQYTELPYS